LATPLLAAGRCVFPIALLLVPIYVAGIILVHAKEGWFVVGAGRNGMEYSVLLVVVLLVLAAHHAPARRGTPGRAEPTR
ncbi:MAG TPA: hypothetical protein VFU59_11025, partial [Candidatus Eisenbacteria bacterium]|nr:hypothetical protein [Candidatus Eisenbacteria bacterium]